MNFGDILAKAKEGGGFDLLPDGVYIAKIIESEAKTSNNGKPQIKARFEIVSGPHAGFKGLWNNFTLTVDNETALRIFYSQLSALGITSEFLDSLANVDADTAFKHLAGALVGKVASIKVKIDHEWNNNKIDRINKAPAEYAASAGAAASPFGGAAPAAPAAPSAPAAAPASPF